LPKLGSLRMGGHIRWQALHHIVDSLLKAAPRKRSIWLIYCRVECASSLDGLRNFWDIWPSTVRILFDVLYILTEASNRCLYSHMPDILSSLPVMHKKLLLDPMRSVASGRSERTDEMLRRKLSRGNRRPLNGSVATHAIPRIQGKE